MSFKPMLAPGEDPLRYPDYFKKLNYPLLCSPKYDGIRCIVKSRMCLSRTGKLLPSYQVQEVFSKYEHFDGELIEGSPYDFNVYNRTQSYVMSEDKPGDIRFYVFDYTHPDWLRQPFYRRLEKLEIELAKINSEEIKNIEHIHVETYDDLLMYEEACLASGFEGIMMRDPVGYYKNGRGTFREGLIYKLKRFREDEAIIIGFEEKMHNTNELQTNELGYAKRSSSKEGMKPANTVGNFICYYNDQEISVAPGAFNHDELQKIWNCKEEFIGELLKFRYFAHGVKDKPRQPRAVGFRSIIDL